MRAPTQTGGRDATTRRISGDFALCVGEPSLPAPPGWRWHKLTDIARLESGHTPSRQHPEYWGGDIPWITLSDARAYDSGLIHETIEQTNELGIANSSARMLPAGTLCLSRTASVGYVVVTGRPMATSQDFVNWVCGEKLDPHFLRYLLIAERGTMHRFSSGAVHQTIYFPEVKAFHVCIPSLTEQKRIVAILDEAFEGIRIATANAEKNLANARELFEAELDEVWRLAGAAKRSRLENLCERITVGHVGPMASRYVEVGVPFLRSQNIRPFRIDLNEVKFIDQGFETELLKSKLRNGDVVVVRTGYPGTAAVVPQNLDGANCADLVIIRCGEKLSPDYLALLLNSRQGKALVGVNLVGAAQKHFNIGAARQLELPVPDMRQQADIVEELGELREVTVQLEHRYAARVVSLSHLKQSILSRAFSGQLTAAKGLAA